MPFKSEAQRRFLYATHPDIAKRWSKEYPGQHDLPEHVKKHLSPRGRSLDRLRREALLHHLSHQA